MPKPTFTSYRIFKMRPAQDSRYCVGLFSDFTGDRKEVIATDLLKRQAVAKVRALNAARVAANLTQS